jgi:GTPase SAR1 family protein
VTENKPDHILIVGQTGAGKSYFIADYIQEIKQVDNKAVFVFPASIKPEPYDKLNPYNKIVKNLQSKLLEEGRKHNINVISSSHLDLATKRLVISQYKTAESHGIREIQISDELTKILTDYKNDLNFSFLVCSPTGHKLVSSSFNRLSNECVDLSCHWGIL